MDVFDIIGPIMIGPSSSHTAGAVRLGAVALALLGEKPKSAVITLYSSFAKTGKGHGTDMAVVGGILGYGIDDARILNALGTKEFSYEFKYEDNDEFHPNTAKIQLIGEYNSVTMRGASVGGGRIEVQEIDGMEVSFDGELNTLIIFHTDQKGVIADISGLLSNNNINIAFMKLYRVSKGSDAIIIIETDQRVEILPKIKKVSGVRRVAYYEKYNA
ncbi:MAG: L-serine ammonia-lyase, iron-sulfur-dependent, subunit beta [Clostridiaceae bacterium]|nr:L-serine ammonia-lyase, iron-sulfur-dependent, subunit beta [Clostridiaceae bacterium]